MREWTIQAGDPCCLTLCCDARLEKTDYANDQIWELHLSSGEPSALSVETSFGLRARLMRIFPRFSEAGVVRSDPASFARVPTVRRMAPNYLAVDYSPFTGIDVLAEYWVPRSQVLAGKISVSNRSSASRSVNLELIAQLNPLNHGHGMTPHQMQITTILEGQTENLAPVLFLNGGPEAGTSSYPALVLNLGLAPNAQRHLTWALAALPDLAESFELARRTTARPWDAEMVRIRLQDNSSQIEIETGDKDWDAAFSFSQRTAYSLLVGPEPSLPHPSFTLTRRPDQGYSLKGTGGDYSDLWNGQTALDAYLLSNLILPGGSAWMRGILQNFLAAQTDDGLIDWKPGLAGQRSRLAAQPLLATLAWRLYQQDPDRAFLVQVFPPLLRFFQAWFYPKYDLDHDGFPEWSRPYQSGLDYSEIPGCQPLLSALADVEAVEDPALGAFLRRECHSLLQIARQIQQVEAVPELERRLNCLQAAVESCWDPSRSTYLNRDRDTHASPAGRLVYEWAGSGTQDIQASFDPPQRLIISFTPGSDFVRKGKIQLIGESTRGAETEVIPADRIRWNQQQASVVTQYPFRRIDQVSIAGLADDDRVVLQTVDYQYENITQLLPLWAMIPSPERAGQIVEQTLMNPDRYAAPYGLSTTPASVFSSTGECVRPVHVSWNTLIGEGLLEYGFRAQAAGLVQRLMAGIVENLRRESAFHSVYAAEGGKIPGQPNHLAGLAPLRLYLETLGVRLISPWKVIITDFNPFPEPVTVQYRGLVIFRDDRKTQVTFPDGQVVTLTDPGTHLITTT